MAAKGAAFETTAPASTPGQKGDEALKGFPGFIKRRVNRRRQGQAGTTVIEALVSMGVLVIASLTVATSTTTSFSAVDRSQVTIGMETALRETMESIQGVDFADLETLDGNRVYTSDAERRVIIIVRVNQVTPTLKAVEVAVHQKKKDPTTNSWTEGDKVFQAMTYRTER